MLWNLQSCVKLNGQLTEGFSVNKGLKQGCIIYLCFLRYILMI